MRIQKYQSPANGIVKQDNTYVAKPIEQKSFKRVYNYFSEPTEIKAYFSRIPYEKWKNSVDRSFDGRIINNPVSEDIFQITDADIMSDIRLQLIASMYNRKPTSYEALKNNLSNKIWGISALTPLFITTQSNSYE